MKINNSYLKKNSTNLATTKTMHWFNFILSVTNKLNITLPTWINVHRLEHFLFVPWPQLKIMCTDGMLLCNDHISPNDNTNLYSLCSLYKSFRTWTQLIKLMEVCMLLLTQKLQINWYHCIIIAKQLSWRATTKQ